MARETNKKPRCESDRARGLRAWLERWWWDFVTIAGYMTADDPDFRRVYLTNVLLLFAISVCGFFLAFHLLITGIYELAVLTAAALAISLGIVVYLRRTRDIEGAATMLNIMAFAGLATYSFLRQGENSALVWSTLYLPFAFFLKGIGAGTAFAAAYCAVVIAGVTYNVTIANPLPPTTAFRTVVNVVISVVAMFGLLYYYEATRREATERLSKAREDLLKLSTTDGLTGLFNRRHFNSVFPPLLARAQREEKVLALLMADVDRFKEYNDRYGHPAGDDVLERVARILGDTLRRNSDLVFRIGGEEFAALFSVSDPAEAQQLAESLRRAVEDEAIVAPEGVGGYVTVSVGLRLYQGDTQEADATATQLHVDADDALYTAKEGGRNQIVIFDSASAAARR